MINLKKENLKSFKTNLETMSIFNHWHIYDKFFFISIFLIQDFNLHRKNKSKLKCWQLAIHL